MLTTTRRRLLAATAAVGISAGLIALAQNLEYLKPLVQFMDTRLQYPDRSWEEYYRRRWQYAVFLIPRPSRPSRNKINT